MPRATLYYCERHRLTFSKTETLNKHLFEKHQALECYICHRRFESPTAIRLHMEVHQKNQQ